MICKTLSLTDRCNYGIDLLRLVAMFMIVILHILGQGSVICIVISWLAHEFVPISAFGIFVNYTSFTIVFVAIFLVSVFSKLQFSSKYSKVIACFAPAAFGVYLIHVQSIVWRHFMNSAFIWIDAYTIWLLPIFVLGSALCLLVFAF